MKVFISFAEQPSRDVAHCLKSFLEHTLQTLEPWLSREDIRRGEFWLPKLLTALKDARYGLLCVTPQNLDSEWMHFEAGMLARHFEAEEESGKVVPILFDVSADQLSRPLGQFQHADFSRDGILQIVNELNEINDKQVNQSVLESAFEQNWGRFEELVNESKTNYAPTEHEAKRARFNQKDAIQEILLICRSLRRERPTKRAGAAALKEKKRRSARRARILSRIKDFLDAGLSDEAIVSKTKEALPNTIERLGWNEIDILREIQSQKKQENVENLLGSTMQP